MESHKNPLRRQLFNFAHLRNRDDRDKKRRNDDNVAISALPLEKSEDTEDIHTYIAAPEYDTHIDMQEILESKVGSTSTEDVSRKSSTRLHSIPSAPAPGNHPRSIDSKLKADDAVSSCGLSYLDELAQSPALHKPESQPSRQSSYNDVSSRVPSRLEQVRVKSRPVPRQLYTREHKRSQRFSTRSPIRFSPGISPDPHQVLFPLQSTTPDNTDAQAELANTDDPGSWSVIIPSSPMDPADGIYELEKRAEQLCSADHLRVILEEPKLLFAFTKFLKAHRPWRLTLLTYYWDATKALRAIQYARAITIALSEKPLPCIGSAGTLPGPCIDERLSIAAIEAFDDLVREDLVAYIAHMYTRMVTASVQRRITGSLSSHLRESSQGLAEVFVLTDPSRPDNPIVLSSQEFALTTGYGLKYVIGRNCRFLQGPKTSEHSIRRLAIAVTEGKEHTELLVNYRRDGSPFLNLLMMVPLLDSRGNVRHFLGAQVDVSGLLKDINSLESVRRLLSNQVRLEDGCDPGNSDRLQAMKAFSLMLGGDELDAIRRHGGYLNQGYSHLHDTSRSSVERHRKRSRILLQGNDEDFASDEENHDEVKEDHHSSGSSDMSTKRFVGVYQNYLVVRPAPSLRILFASASLRVPGMLQSHLLHRIGGSSKIRVDFERSLQKGNAVTARVHWLSVPNRYGDGIGRVRWLHCTPLLHHSGAVGAWVVIVVDEENDSESGRSESRG